MPHQPIRPILPLAIFILMIFQQCAQKRATPVIDSIAATQQINANGITRVTAKCPQGKQMVGGGYTVNPNNVNIKINVRASYPVTKDTWEVDIMNSSGNNTDDATLTVYAYYYTGDKDPGMNIKAQEATFAAPPPFGFVNVLFTSGIQKPSSSDVITSGGFKISSTNSIDDISVLGSYPTLESKVGTIDNVAGWTNKVCVLGGKTCNITNYIMYSMGEIKIPQNIPVFDQGSAIKKNSSSIAQGNLPSYELEGNSDYFCTGGGYNLHVSNNAIIYYPINVWQNNANTNTGIFFGWQFSGHDFGAFGGNPNWDIYALQLKLH